MHLETILNLKQKYQKKIQNIKNKILCLNYHQKDHRFNLKIILLKSNV
jgi:hypothetical protein